MLQPMGSKRVGYDLATKQQQQGTFLKYNFKGYFPFTAITKHWPVRIFFSFWFLLRSENPFFFSYSFYQVLPASSVSETMQTLNRMGFLGSSGSKESACNAGDPGSVPVFGRSPREGNGNPLCILAWRIPWTDSGVANSWTQLSD